MKERVFVKITGLVCNITFSYRTVTADTHDRLFPMCLVIMVATSAAEESLYLLGGWDRLYHRSLG